MGVRIIQDIEQDIEVIYCSTSMVCFGPVMETGEAQDFLDWLPDDARHYTESELNNQYWKWRVLKETESI